MFAQGQIMISAWKLNLNENKSACRVEHLGCESRLSEQPTEVLWFYCFSNNPSIYPKAISSQWTLVTIVPTNPYRERLARKATYNEGNSYATNQLVRTQRTSEDARITSLALIRIICASQQTFLVQGLKIISAYSAGEGEGRQQLWHHTVILCVILNVQFHTHANEFAQGFRLGKPWILSTASLLHL